MNLKKLPVKLLSLLVIVRICRGGINIDESHSKNTELVRAAIKIFKSCYGTQIDTIGIGGNSFGILIALLSEELIPVISISESRRWTDSGPITPMIRNKLQFFAIMTSSSTELAATLVMMKKSRYWNHMAKFYIIDSPVSKDGCSRAHEILSTAWKMNLLEAKFMCIRETKDRLIYSFNPYTRDAPKPWKLEKIYDGVNNHPWALFVRKYRDDHVSCKNMDFDKTKDLGGYEIRASIRLSHEDNETDIEKSGIDAFKDPTRDVIRSILRTLNATSKWMIHKRNECRGYVNKEGKPCMLAELADETVDVAFIFYSAEELMMYQSLKFNVPPMYPSIKNGISALTQYRGYMSQLNKIVSLFDVASRIGFCIVCLVTLIFFKYYLHQTFGNAALNTSRLIFNSCLVKLPTNQGARIFLTSLFIFIVTIVGIYQGKLASLLSSRVLLPNINTMKDLAESKYPIYGDEHLKKFFSDQSWAGRYEVVRNGSNCTEYVLRDPLAVCIGSTPTLISDAAHFKLHISKHPIRQFDLNWMVREDWPLEQRVNEINQKLVEANYIREEFARHELGLSHTIEVNGNEDREGDLKVLTLSELGFEFVILGIGLSCATVCFIVEIFNGYRARKRIAKIRARRRQQFQ